MTSLLSENDRVMGQGPFTNLRCKSTKMPPPIESSNLDVFLDMVTREIERIPSWNEQIPSNLSDRELTALKQLERDSRITIKPSDKGGNLVVMDTCGYKEMTLTLLQDRESYRIIGRDPTNSFKEELEKLLIRGLDDHLISDQECKYMCPVDPQIPTFYALPKIHKGVMPLKGRPIVSGVNSITQKLGIYLDQILREFVSSLPSYIRDTSDLLQKIDGIQLDSDMLLASIDVEALYSSIRHVDGLRAVSYYLQTRGIHFRTHSEYVIQLLEFLLTHNYFIFDSRYYHQLRGTAMGSPVAPSYANLTLGWWESTIVFGEEDSKWNPHLIYWGRYIDDVFVVWSGSENLFKEFVEGLNHNPLGLKFTFEIDRDELPFLDVLIRRGENGLLETSTFRKPTSTNSLLRWDSFHPIPLKKGIPTGQFLRIRRNCSSMEGFNNQARDLRDRFVERGYPSDVLFTSFNRALTSERKELLTPKNRTIEDNSVRLIGTYDNQSERVKNILKRYWPLLRSDQDLNDIVSPYPMITFRRGRSIRDRLVHSHFVEPTRQGTWLDRKPLGTFRCGRCRACSNIQQSKSFTSVVTGREYTIRDFANCDTEGVIYVGTCTCPLQYIGKTKRSFKKRIREHVCDIQNRRDTPVSLHMWAKHGGDTRCISFCAMEVIRKSPRGGEWDRRILQKESEWIFRMRSVSPFGLNERLTYSCFL
ncbi:uncharacterized protein LOC130275860 [Hyla sarda]|uniref:uncharacterized protein LOC130275856 n=1 Tax=Hyla sarda TaxID=327740 RepID=UPI0024C40DEF|nr:uncharacterized protein LOC130275856 [Hyla sarda]XP_056380388.1 uncharacterized protein LOC130275856 [Hyla sarda]XP_056380389.1 uncharacterized protein LOC130275856 [Hyla sarda]XP_056380390.1 uncharacterized protein LOC130275856 [Hyla sarda]XP_056380391.1 uncharacterized protein LOC130275857 [Hyla sarda]XP_056380392.1 uncharacterized protein LOC130275857 [Hyla sarda]XP_056380393.1 uncharacterized protein LOC130275857 [Hyla sarda]XP_056380394.1 uncharacterized protein LOC130275857 [Hyla sa